MNKRQRKKWLKQQGQYIPNLDMWRLPYVMAEFILPRLKKYKNCAWGYPGIDEASTYEGWMEVLDKMILAFEYILDDEWWVKYSEYDITTVIETRLEYFEELERRQSVINEGMLLFGKYFNRLGN